MGSGEPDGRKAQGQGPRLTQGPDVPARIGRVVVKVGTSTLTDADGSIDRPFIADLAAQIAARQAAGQEILLVTSGAIRAGRDRLECRKRPNLPSGAHHAPSFSPDSLPYKQAAAATGQGVLMQTYSEAFAWRNVDCAQILLTRDDLADRRRFLNARNTLLALLSLGVIPVINENDTVAVDAIQFGDNDNLAALVATLVEADLLLILSDVDGLYERPPGTEPDRPNPIISCVSDMNTLQASTGGSTSDLGTGGMSTKVQAARIVTESGIRAVIVRGRRERVVVDVLEGAEIGTQFLPSAEAARLPARKRWIAHSARARGHVVVNTCAVERLMRDGVSLLAVGIVSTGGSFRSGDLIEVRDESGCAFARGLSNYAVSEVRRIQGAHSDQFEGILGYKGFEEVIHRDNLVVENAHRPDRS